MYLQAALRLWLGIMLTLQDYEHKSIIFTISGQDHILFQSEQTDKSKNHLRFGNENLVLEDKANGKIKNQMPCVKIFAVFVIGGITITSSLLEKASFYGFSIIFLKYNFRVYSFMGSQTEGNTLLRSKQYQIQNNMTMSVHVVENKISNQLACLKEIREKNQLIKNSIAKLTKILTQIRETTMSDNPTLLGLEGNASKIFFKAYFADCDWQSRKPRVKLDPINTLLDIGYTFLFHFIEAHLRLYGFDVYVGFYHRLFYQRKSLVCDLIEPFRCIIDKSIRKNFNLGRFQKRDFIVKRNKYALRRDKSKKYTQTLFEDILKYKIEIFSYVRDYYRAFIREKEIHEYPVFSID